MTLRSASHTGGGFLAGYLSCLVLPFPASLAPVVAFYLWAKGRKDKIARRVAVAAAAGTALRFLLLSAVLLAGLKGIYLIPEKITPPAFTSFLVVCGDVGMIEKLVHYHCYRVARGGKDTDPFSGLPLKRSPAGTAYSVGPDRRDGALSVIYDPSNGTMSAGDVLSGVGEKPRAVANTRILSILSMDPAKEARGPIVVILFTPFVCLFAVILPRLLRREHKGFG